MDTLSKIAAALQVPVQDLFASVETPQFQASVDGLEYRVAEQRDCYAKGVELISRGLGIAVLFATPILALTMHWGWHVWLAIPVYWGAGRLALEAAFRLKLNPKLDERCRCPRQTAHSWAESRSMARGRQAANGIIAGMTIFESDVLVIQQTKNLMKNDFAILNGEGVQVAHVETGGSALGRMFAGSRQLTVFDGPDNPVLQVKDTMSVGRDRMEIMDGQGNQIATLVKRITFFKTKVTVDFQGEEIDMDGNLWDFEFQISARGQVIATVSRSWSGLGNALIGKSTYAVRLAPTLSPGHRLMTVGAVLALDLIREKQSRG